MEYRKPTQVELDLIKFLVNQSSLKLPFLEKHNLLVSSLEDGRMGSLKLCHNTCSIDENRAMGKMVSEYLFKDIDEIDVVVSLYLDEKGELYELEIWKTDFSELVKIPENF